MACYDWAGVAGVPEPLTWLLVVGGSSPWPGLRVGAASADRGSRRAMAR